MHFVYRFINKENTVIYVGKTSQSLAQRFNQHEHLPSECYEQVEHIEYIECRSAAETQIKEVYYINLYKDNKPYFNILDLAEPIHGVILTDAWTLYEGPLPPVFSSSWNRRVGLKSNGSGAAGSATADHLTSSEINRMFERYLLQLKQAGTPNLKKVALRDILIFSVGINSPLRPKELVSIQYRDLYNPDDTVKPLEYKLSRSEGDLVLEISHPQYVQDILRLYREVAHLSFARNECDPICKSRAMNTPITVNALCRRMRESSSAIGLESRISANTLRKTYLMNIYDSMDDKAEALILLDRLNGGSRLSTVADYLGLYQEEKGFEVICECRYPCGRISVETIIQALENHRERPSRPSARLAFYETSEKEHLPSENEASVRKCHQPTTRSDTLSYCDKNGRRVSDERISEIKRYVDSNPYFLYSELESVFNISVSMLLRIVSENGPL